MTLYTENKYDTRFTKRSKQTTARENRFILKYHVKFLFDLIFKFMCAILTQVILVISSARPVKLPMTNGGTVKSWLQNTCTLNVGVLSKFP